MHLHECDTPQAFAKAAAGNSERFCAVDNVSRRPLFLFALTWRLRVVTSCCAFFFVHAALQLRLTLTSGCCPASFPCSRTQAFLDDHVELRSSASFGDVSAMVEHWMSLEDNNDADNLEEDNGMDAFSF